MDMAVVHPRCSVSLPRKYLRTSKRTSEFFMSSSSSVGGLSFHITKGNRFGPPMYSSGLQHWKRGSRERDYFSVSSLMKPPSKDYPSTLGLGDHISSVGSSETASHSDNDCKILPDLWPYLSGRHGESVALYDPHGIHESRITFRELNDYIEKFAEGLKVLGVKEGNCVSLFSENSVRWIIADQGVMSVGAHNAVRGAKASSSELLHIASHSESIVMVLENDELLEKLTSGINEDVNLTAQLKFVVVLWRKGDTEAKKGHSNDGSQYPAQHTLPCPIYSYEDILATGTASLQASKAAGRWVGRRSANTQPGDLATIVYTSGTSGFPKGVMLTHANLMHQVNHLGSVFDAKEGEVILSLLPPWHMYERSAEYFVLSRGVQQIYSSVKTFKDDLAKHPPHYFVAVPIVFDILYCGVQKKLASASATQAAIAKFLIAISLKFVEAKRVMDGLDLSSVRQKMDVVRASMQWLQAAITVAVIAPLYWLANTLVFKKIRAALGIRKMAISGGGSLPAHVDLFFAAIGITLLNGYGLTETSPVLSVRSTLRNVLGSVGTPIPGTEICIVHPDTDELLPVGMKGVVKAKGPQVMKGYFKDPAATASAIDEHGFFNTGDLGWLVPLGTLGGGRNCGGQLVLDGRAKDTIVLASGENVEPARIEEIVLKSDLIHQVMVVGQDERRLGALVVPNESEVKRRLQQRQQSEGEGWEATAAHITAMIKSELDHYWKESGAQAHERIGPVLLVDEPFSFDNGLLTATLKVRRESITAKYKSQILALFS